MKRRLLQGEKNVYLCTKPVDMRKSINGLAAMVQSEFGLDPYTDCLFLFCNRVHNKVKILQWDKDGFILFYKRREKGRFVWPDTLWEGETNQIDRSDLLRFLDGLVMEAYIEKKRWNIT